MKRAEFLYKIAYFPFWLGILSYGWMLFQTIKLAFSKVVITEDGGYALDYDISYFMTDSIPVILAACLVIGLAITTVFLFIKQRHPWLLLPFSLLVMGGQHLLHPLTQLSEFMFFRYALGGVFKPITTAGPLTLLKVIPMLPFFLCFLLSLIATILLKKKERAR